MQFPNFGAHAQPPWHWVFTWHFPSHHMLVISAAVPSLHVQFSQVKLTFWCHGSYFMNLSVSGACFFDFLYFLCTFKRYSSSTLKRHTSFPFCAARKNIFCTKIPSFNSIERLEKKQSWIHLKKRQRKLLQLSAGDAVQRKKTDTLKIPVLCIREKRLNTDKSVLVLHVSNLNVLVSQWENKTKL